MSRVKLPISRDYDLSNRIFADEAEIDAACARSWQQLTPQRIRTITHTQWLEREN